jgi:hypothetical protein
VWNDVVRHAESRSKLTAVPVVPVEELDHSGGVARRASALLDAVAVDRIDKPDAAVHDERVRAALEELIDDPAECEPELVAEPDLHVRVLQPSAASP